MRGSKNFLSPIQIQLSLKQKHFLNFFVPFLESTLNFIQFEKKMIVIATSFRNLQTLKDFVSQSLKKSVSEHPLKVHMLKAPKLLSNRDGKSFMIFFHNSERTRFEKYLP